MQPPFCCLNSTRTSILTGNVYFVRSTEPPIMIHPKKGKFIMEKPIKSWTECKIWTKAGCLTQWLTAGHKHGDNNPTYGKLQGFVQKT